MPTQTSCTARGRLHPRAVGAGSKNLVMIILAVVMLGAAGYLAYSRLGGSSPADVGDGYQAAMDWKHRLSRRLTADEAHRFSRVQLDVNHNLDKGETTIDIAGSVATQADLDAFSRLLGEKDLAPPMAHTMRLKVEPQTMPPTPTPPAPPTSPAPAGN